MRNLNTKGLKRGRPPLNRLENFEDNYVKEGDCWLWIGPKTVNGYGMASRKVNGFWKTTMAHRVVYEKLVGPIPEGMHLDHLCMKPACINPAHLEPVTQAENSRRSWEGRNGSTTLKKQIVVAIKGGNRAFWDVVRATGADPIRVNNYLQALRREGVIASRTRGFWEVISEKYD